jgi:hypothetical protein
VGHLQLTHRSFHLHIYTLFVECLQSCKLHGLSAIYQCLPSSAGCQNSSRQDRLQSQSCARQMQSQSCARETAIIKLCKRDCNHKAVQECDNKAVQERLQSQSCARVRQQSCARVRLQKCARQMRSQRCARECDYKVVQERITAVSPSWLHWHNSANASSAGCTGITAL